MAYCLNVWTFRSGFAGRGRDTRVCVFDEAVMCSFISREEVEAHFFGYVLFSSLPSKMGYLGVWGARNSSRLRRMLRESGAELAIAATPPPLSLALWVTQGKARAQAMIGQPPIADARSVRFDAALKPPPLPAE